MRIETAGFSSTRCSAEKQFLQGLKRVCGTRKLREPSGAHCRSLGFPGFPVDLVGVDELHAVFSFGKPHTRLCPEQRGRKSGFARDDKGEGSASSY